MTAQNGTQKSVLLSLVVKQVQKRYREKASPLRKKQLSSLSNDLEKWGDCVIYENAQLREIVAASVSHRLGLGFRYVKSRFDQIHRIASYDQEEVSS